ncbi:MAG TPA: DUF4296 domain-containing protein [Mucilaginibacter sp.]
MHKYNKLFFSVLIFLAACKSGPAPGEIIKKDRMVTLLTEIHIVDGSMYNLMQVPDTLYKYGTGRYMAVFKKYNTDSVQFRKSFKYYSARPDLMQSIYEQVSKNIKQKTDSLNKLSNEQMTAANKRRADSISKLPKDKQVQPQPATQLPTPSQKPKNMLHQKPNKGNAVPVE